jgi:uncharacterized protein YdaL
LTTKKDPSGLKFKERGDKTMIITTNKEEIKTNTTKIDINKTIQYLQEQIKTIYKNNLPTNVYITKCSEDFAKINGTPKKYATYYTIKALKELKIVENTDKRGLYLLNVKKLFEYK